MTRNISFDVITSYKDVEFLQNDVDNTKVYGVTIEGVLEMISTSYREGVDYYDDKCVIRSKEEFTGFITDRKEHIITAIREKYTGKSGKSIEISVDNYIFNVEVATPVVDVTAKTGINGLFDTDGYEGQFDLSVPFSYYEVFPTIEKNQSFLNFRETKEGEFFYMTNNGERILCIKGRNSRARISLTDGVAVEEDDYENLLIKNRNIVINKIPQEKQAYIRSVIGSL